MDWLIRTATTHDIPDLARLRWDFLPDEVAAGAQTFDAFVVEFAAFLETALQSDEWSVWVAEADASIVANAYVRISPKLPRPGRFGERHGYVTNVYVEPAQPRHRLGADAAHCSVGTDNTSHLADAMTDRGTRGLL